MRVVLASQNADRLAAAVDELRAEGAEVVGVPTDVSDEAAVRALATATLDTFGAVHVLVNNAGVWAPGYAWEISRADWEWVIGVNLWGPIHAIRVFVPHLLEQPEAHVVNVSSAGGLMAATVHSPYSTAKHGLVGLSKGLRADLALKGANVGVTLVCPGAVSTAIMSQIENTGPGGIPREDGRARARGAGRVGLDRCLHRRRHPRRRRRRHGRHRDPREPLLAPPERGRSSIRSSSRSSTTSNTNAEPRRASRVQAGSGIRPSMRIAAAASGPRQPSR